MDPLYPADVTMLALLLILFINSNAAQYRDIKRLELYPPLLRLPHRWRWIAPQPPLPHALERAERVQRDTLENMVIFLPSMWLYAWSVSAN